MNNSDKDIGASLFAGAGSVHIENNMEEDDDEEDLEDQKRRQAELQNLIANAFGDEENSYLNSSGDEYADDTNTSKLNKGHESNLRQSLVSESAYENTSVNSMEQLQMLYQARIQDINYLMKQIDQLKTESKEELNKKEERIKSLENECKRANLSREQLQNLLVNKTKELNDNSVEITSLREQMESLKKSEEKDKQEIQFWKSNSNELEKKLHLVEKGLMNTNINENQIRSHYEQEMNDLKNALQKCNKQLEQSERECRNLKTALNESRHENEVMQFEKGQIINKITKSLEESQLHRSALLKEIDRLQTERQSMQQEFLTMKSEMQSNNKPNEEHEKIINTLRNELKRSIDEQGEKRNEIIKFKSEIDELKQAQNKLKIELKDKVIELKEAEIKLRKMEEIKQDKIKDELKFVKDPVENDTTAQNRLNNNCVVDSNYLQEQLANSNEKCLKLDADLLKAHKKIIETETYINNLNEQLFSNRNEYCYCTEIWNTFLSTTDSIITRYCNSNGNKSYEFLLELKKVNKDDCVKIKRLLEEKYELLNNGFILKTTQLSALMKENNYLKTKLIDDRNALTDLTNLWTEESQKYNSTLKSHVEFNVQLKITINQLTIKCEEYNAVCNDLQTTLNGMKDYIVQLKAKYKRREEHIAAEYETVAKKYQSVLETIQNRVHKSVNRTNDVFKSMQNL